MLNILKNNDLIITENKKEILKYLSDNKIMLNLKIMTLNEFKNNYFGFYNEEAIYYLINKYGYKYDIAKTYLNNFLFIPSLKKELEENNLINYTPLFKDSFKRVINIDCNIDPFIENELNKYEYIKIENENNNYIHPVYEFESIDDEINFIALKIIELLKEKKLNDIVLVNVTEEYKMPLKRIFGFYNIPVNLNIDKNIYGTKQVKLFLEKLKETRNIEQSLIELNQDEIYNKIIDICNKYVFKDIDDTIIYCIECELKKSTLKETKYKDSIKVIDINEMFDKDKYYFILGFNQGILPKVYKDEDLLSDKEKQKLGLFTSLQKNILEKTKVKNILSNFPNTTLSYKLKSYKETYYKSSLIEELNLEIKKEKIESYNYSNIYNKLSLSEKLDNYLKFNIKDEDLNLLYSNYKDIPYLKYNNNYTKINKDNLLKYINNYLSLSYSSIDNYYRCGFRYYINNILKLNKYEETFMTYIGNLFHFVLSNAFNDNFDFETCFNDYIKDKEFTHKEMFFINKLKEELLFTINVIKKQDEYTLLSNSLYEQRITVDKSKDTKVYFTGIIDKLKYENIDNKNIVAIIDYKTGTPEVNINNTIYGIGMQLPIYLYLSRHSDIKNAHLAGFYLQKIVHNKLKYSPGKIYEKEYEKLYRLDGYSNDDINILNKLDKNYSDSYMIKGMKTSSKGFYPYTKVLNNKQIDTLKNIVESKIDEGIENILNSNFDINPKKIGLNLVGCEFCKFKDICYKKEENIVNLKEQNYKDFLGGEDNA